MNSNETDKRGPAPKRRYAWPWLVLGAIILAVVLAVLWMSREIERTRRIRDLNSPTKTGAASPPSLSAMVFLPSFNWESLPSVTGNRFDAEWAT